MRFAFVLAERATWSVVLMCAVLKVSTSGFYAWLKREPSAHDKKDERLTILIGESFAMSRKTYGSPRVHADLADEHVGRNRVIRIMQKEKLVARVRKRYRSTTMSEHDQPIAPNVLNREFEAAAPNQRWVGDTTELLTATGRFYLAAIVDLYARIVVGWAMSAVNDRHLTMAALEAAIKRRRPDIGLLHHSDRGSTYTCEDYRELLAKHGLVCSMSRTGNCYDNAAMESWNSTFKLEARRHVRIDSPRQGPRVRLHRGVLQPAPSSLVHRLRRPGRVRATLLREPKRHRACRPQRGLRFCITVFAIRLPYHNTH